MIEPTEIQLSGRLYFLDGTYMDTAPRDNRANTAAIVRSLETQTTAFSSDNVYINKRLRVREEIESQSYVKAKRIRFEDPVDPEVYTEQTVAYDDTQLDRVSTLETGISSVQDDVSALQSQQVAMSDLISVLQGETQQLEDGDVIMSAAVQSAVNALQAAIDLRALITAIPTRSSLSVQNVDNTRDIDKPLSTQVTAALANVQSQIDSLFSSDISLQGYIDNLVLGLSNLTQTVSDSGVASSASIEGIQLSIDTMQTLVNGLPRFVDLPTKSSLGLSLVDNTSDVDKPISAATQTALDGLQQAINNCLTPSALTEYATTQGVADYVQQAIQDFQDSAEVASSIAAALSGFESTAEVTTAIMDAIAPLASTTYVNNSIQTALATYITQSVMEAYVVPAISTAVSDYDSTIIGYVDTREVAIRDDLSAMELSILNQVSADYATLSNVSSSISTALSSYATNSYVSSALVPYITSADSASAIASALVPYSTSSQVGTAIQTALATYWDSSQVNSAIQSELISYLDGDGVDAAISTALAAYPSTSAMNSAISAALLGYSSTNAMNQAITNAIAAIPTNNFGSTDAQALIDSSLASYYDSGEMDTQLALKADVSVVDASISTINSSLASQASSITALQSDKASIDSPTFTGTVVTPALRVTGGTPSAGLVLTASDSLGNASWSGVSSGLTSVKGTINSPFNTSTAISTPSSWGTYNVASIALTPGTWMLVGSMLVASTTATTYTTTLIYTTTATWQAGVYNLDAATALVDTYGVKAGIQASVSLPASSFQRTPIPMRSPTFLTVASNTTVYLNGGFSPSPSVTTASFPQVSLYAIKIA